MKISNSKKQLAKIIHENGGWRDGEFAAQDGDGGVGGYEIKPEWNSLAKYWWRGAWGEWFLTNKIKNHHQTVLSRAEYFHLYPAPDADGWIEWEGGMCPVEKYAWVETRRRDGEVVEPTPSGLLGWQHFGSCEDIVAYRIIDPERISIEPTPTIEQLAADYRNAKDYADRKQQEADAAKADAEAKLAELVAAGKALGLALSVTGAESGPEQVIIDWRDLRVDDLIWYAGDDELSSGEYHVMGIESPDYEGYRTVLVNSGNGGHWIDTREGWGFIRRP